MCVVQDRPPVLIGGLLSPTTENNLTPSLNNGHGHLPGKWAFASKLDIADVVKQGKIMFTFAERMEPQKSILPE